MTPGPVRPRELPDGFDNWPREAQVSWLKNECSQAQMFATLLDMVDIEIPDDAWPRADMVTKNVVAHAVASAEEQP